MRYAPPREPLLKHHPRLGAMRHALVLLGVLLLAGCTASNTTEALNPDEAGDGITVGGVLYVPSDTTVRTRIGEETARNGTFLVLRMGVRNAREETATITADQFTVQAGSAAYHVSEDAAAALQENGEDAVLDRQRIDPSFTTQTVLAFDVPVQATYTLHITQNGEAGRMELTQ